MSSNVEKIKNILKITPQIISSYKKANERVVDVVGLFSYTFIVQENSERWEVGM